MVYDTTELRIIILVLIYMFAIHTVFILRENILFLEEWIDYHLQLGFDKFYLYDNSKVQRSGGFHIKHKVFKEGAVNKYGINYDKLVPLTNDVLYSKLNEIIKKYKGHIILVEWSPKDLFNRVMFNQQQAHNSCLKKLKNDKILWCANIDMDEYIVLKNHNTIKEYINSLDANISAVSMSQKVFSSRFNNMDKNVTEINLLQIKQPDLTMANKCIYKVSQTISLDVHNAHVKGSYLITKLKNIWFNHYKSSSTTLSSYSFEDNINENIKNHINTSCKNYVKIL